MPTLILTGEAAKKAQALDEQSERLGLEPRELSEQEQIRLYTIYSAFFVDKVFAGYIDACATMYAQAAVTRQVPKMLDLLAEVAREIEGR